MAYDRIDTVKVKDPHTPGDYILVNASDYGDGRAFSPDDYPIWGTPAQRSTLPPPKPDQEDEDDKEKVAKGAGASAAPVKK